MRDTQKGKLVVFRLSCKPPWCNQSPFSYDAPQGLLCTPFANPQNTKEAQAALNYRPVFLPLQAVAAFSRPGPIIL